ncbi:hypothetical protein ABT370_32680, partial [Streptomyces rubradiris]
VVRAPAGDVHAVALHEQRERLVQTGQQGHPAPPRPTSPAFWLLSGFDTVMRVRNALWRPPFVMYYRALRLGALLGELERAGFTVELRALPGFGRRADGSPRGRLVVARNDGPPGPAVTPRRAG